MQSRIINAYVIYLMQFRPDRDFNLNLLPGILRENYYLC